MRIINKTDEPIVIEPGQDIDIRGTERRLRTTASRMIVIEIDEVKRKGKINAD